MIIKVVGLLKVRFHTGLSSYVTFRDMVLLLQSVTACTIGITLFDAMLLADTVIPRSVILLDWGVTLAMLGLVRVLPRLIQDTNWRLVLQSTKAPLP